MRFDLLFVFGSEGPVDPAAAAQIRRFLREAPNLLKGHSKRDIEYEVSQITVNQQLELRCQLNVVPTWPAAAHLTDAQMIRMGIPHPTRTRATTALLLWIASMHGSDPAQNPLIRAWRDFTGDQTATSPISIKAYDYHVSRPTTTRKIDTVTNPETPPAVRWHNDV